MSSDAKNGGGGSPIPSDSDSGGGRGDVWDEEANRGGATPGENDEEIIGEKEANNSGGVDGADIHANMHNDIVTEEANRNVMTMAVNATIEEQIAFNESLHAQQDAYRSYQEDFVGRVDSGTGGAATESGLGQQPGVEENQEARVPGIMFIPGPDYTGNGVHTGYNSDQERDEFLEGLARLGIPFVEADPVFPVENAESQHAHQDSPSLRNEIAEESPPGDFVHAEHVPTFDIFGRKIPRMYAVTVACLGALILAVAIVVPTTLLSTNNANTEEDPRKVRIANEITTIAQGDVKNQYSPQGLAMAWMLGENNTQMDVPRDSELIKQRFTLAVLFYSTGGESSWTETGNFLSADHVCEWSEQQVGCDDKDEVTELNLADNELGGILPRELSYLSRLKHLNLARNPGLSGLLSEIGELSSLETLDFSDNSFEGTISANFANLSNLTYLSLHNNDLTGTEWSTIVPRLKNLRHLDLGKNKFSPNYASLDPIDLEYDTGYEAHRNIFGLTHLEYLDLSEIDLRFSQFFQFDIPITIGNLVNLTVLNMASSGIGGRLPTQLGKLIKLEEMLLSGNELGRAGITQSEGIPTELGELKELKRMSLESTDIGGEIPSTLGKLTKLEDLNLNFAGLTGQIPHELGRLDDIVILKLGGNSLNGPIPAGLFHDKLEELLLLDNELSGSIPAEIGNATGLQYFLAGGNRLEGSIPPEIGNATALTALSLYDNMLSSSLPDTIGNLLELDSIELDGNGLTGELPSSMGNLEKLMYFHAADNSFGSTLPTALGMLTALQELGLTSCGMTGGIPTEMGNLVNLSYLALDDNELSGPFPEWMGAKLQNLEYFYLGWNKFNGTLPVEWSEFPQIINLQLQNNNLLTGTIPEEWANITTLTGLYLHGTNLTGGASFLCREDLGNNTCEDCGLTVDSAVECECCACCGDHGELSVFMNSR